ncbi:MAG: recombination mediator RecR [Patescibacteria group bacterium]
MPFPNAIQNLIEQFNRLPGIGSKTSERFIFYLLKQPKQNINEFIRALDKLKTEVRICSECQNFSEQSPCRICADASRDRSIICVVAESPDIIALEKTSEYQGLYHVLNGTINEIDGINLDQLKFKELLQRIKNNNIQEIILAFDANMESETTAMYLMRELKPLNIKITRLARGLPMGSDIEYADEVTLSNAIQERKEI